MIKMGLVSNSVCFDDKSFDLVPWCSAAPALEYAEKNDSEKSEIGLHCWGITHSFLTLSW